MKQAKPKMIQNVFVLLLLSLFACLSTVLVTMGARVYRDTVQQADSNNNARIVAAVVRSAIWAEDGGKIYVEDFDDIGVTSLTIENDYDGEIYKKRLYCKDGYLWESFTSSERVFTGESGESLCEAAGFEPSVEGNMLSVLVSTEDGTSKNLNICLRAGGAGQ